MTDIFDAVVVGSGATGSWAARELFAFPFFYTAATGITSFRRGVRGPTSVLPVLKVGTWNIHEWEMD